MFNENNNNKKYLLAGGVIVLIVISLVFAVEYYNQLNQPANSDNQKEILEQKEAEIEPNIPDSAIDLSDKAKNTDNKDNQLNNNESEEYVGPWVGHEAMGIDQDADGLYDFEEEKIGTNPNNRDTDNDELDDYYEVRIYKTNSLNPDTDGDGYKDGEELKNGFNPLGEGKF